MFSIQKLYHVTTYNKYNEYTINNNNKRFISFTSYNEHNINRLYLKNNHNKFFTIEDLKIEKFDIVYCFSGYIIEYNYNNGEAIYLYDNGLLHSFKKPMKQYEHLSYYIYDIEYTYEQWLNHPEVKRNSRNTKLELI